MLVCLRALIAGIIPAHCVLPKCQSCDRSIPEVVHRSKIWCSSSFPDQFHYRSTSVHLDEPSDNIYLFYTSFTSNARLQLQKTFLKFVPSRIPEISPKFCAKQTNNSSSNKFDAVNSSSIGSCPGTAPAPGPLPSPAMIQDGYGCSVLPKRDNARNAC